MIGKPILCLDFDGVVHSYTSGWQGADVIPDPPVPGAMDFLYRCLGKFRVAIFSSRSNQPSGIQAMRTWLARYAEADLGREKLGWETPWWTAIEWPTEKPPAFLTIDDRALTFTGEWPAINDLLAFKPWNKG